MYEPLLFELEDIPVIQFVNLAMRKLAVLMIEKDYTPEDLKQLLNPQRSLTLSIGHFKKALFTLNSYDFQFSDDDIERVFQSVTLERRIVNTSTISWDAFSNALYRAVSAQLIEKIKAGIKHSGSFIIDVLSTHDRNKDGYLTYAEFDNAML